MTVHATDSCYSKIVFAVKTFHVDHFLLISFYRRNASSGISFFICNTAFSTSQTKLAFSQHFKCSYSPFSYLYSTEFIISHICFEQYIFYVKSLPNTPSLFIIKCSSSHTEYFTLSTFYFFNFYHCRFYS